MEDTAEKCPNCGAVNEHIRRTAIGTPKTIEELKQWYIEHNLPPEETTRFFIGKNYTGARAFGIYEDEAAHKFVVYKNKGDGTRAIRYEGQDEEYAVNELYLKLKEEIINQKNNNVSQNSVRSTTRSGSNFIDRIKKIFMKYLFLLAILFICSGAFFAAGRNKRNGYYRYNNEYYYYQNGSWYEYDDDWNRVYNVPSELQNNREEYFNSSSYKSDYNIDNFKNSGYYVAPSTSSSSSDWDSSSSWDSGSSWDSSSTDWSSDW